MTWKKDHIVFKQCMPVSNQTVCIAYEGQPKTVPEGISVAAAVMGHTGDHHCRCSVISKEKRAPYCLMGVCHECLMEIDGNPYQQACLIMVRDGMTVKKHEFAGGQPHGK